MNQLSGKDHREWAATVILNDGGTTRKPCTKNLLGRQPQGKDLHRITGVCRGWSWVDTMRR